MVDLLAQALPGRTIHVVATPRQRGPAWRGLPTRVTSPPAWPPTRSCTDPNPAHRQASQARPYTLAPATTDLTSTGEQIVARYASRWSSNSRSRTARTSWAPAEINQQVLGNLDQIIAALEADQALPIAQEVADAR